MSVSGLTSQEVQERVSRGEVNSVEQVVSRSYADIIIKNVCTTFNLLLFIMGAVLLILNEYINALAATIVIIFNILIATIQEIKAKKRLDKIALLMRPKVTVIRDGQESVIDQAEIVMDDMIVLNPGDQALVDGVIAEKEYLEMDESLLTGESSTVRKHDGDTIYSGSYCVTGKGIYKVTAFGEDSFASKMLKSARKYTDKTTPLQMETAAITKLLMLIAFIFAIIMAIITVIKYTGDPKLASMIANNIVISLDIVPIALFLLIVITYMIAAIRMANGGVLLQRANAVESISHVDTVCMDKTGTITTNKLLFKEMVDYTGNDEADDLVRLFANSTGSVNHTTEALLNKFGRIDVKAIDEIRFSSERKYSAVKVEYNGKVVTMYMGALSALGPHLDKDPSDRVAKYSSQGLRTVLLGIGDDVQMYNDNNDLFIPDLRLVAVIAITDEVRSDCRDTIDVFLRNGTDIKVISGDDPATVDALFSIANIPGERKILSGDQLDALEGEERTKAILETNIFGRMKPDHKEMVVETLKVNGRYVAMVGDGVNDVKSLKTAHVGVALQSGSGAARGVSDMVLVDDNFAALPKALVEGKKTVSGMRDILKFYLSRNFLIAFLVIFIMIIAGSILSKGATPLLPTQNTVYGFLAVAIAAFFMAIWAKPSDNKDAILPGVLRYAIPSAFITAIFAVAIYVVFYFLTANGAIVLSLTDHEMCVLGWPSYNFTSEGISQMLTLYGVSSISEIPVERVAEIVARNAMLMFCIFQGITQIFIIVPRWKFFSIDGRLHDDVKPTILIFVLYAVAIGAYIAATKIDWLLDFFPVLILPAPYLLVLAALVALWLFSVLFLLKSGKMDFFIRITERWYQNKFIQMAKAEAKINAKRKELEARKNA